MAEDWLADVRKYAADADEGVVGAIVRYCGIALQSRDSSLVAMSDKKERELVRENYLKKKLGLVHPDADLDAAVVAVGQVMKEDRTKNRVTVYYLLAEHFGLLSIFGGATGTSGGTSAAPLAAAGLAGAGLAGAGMASTATPIPDPIPEPVAAPVTAAAMPDPVATAPAPAVEPVAAYSSYDNNDDSSGGGGMGWLKWLLLAAVVALLLFFLLRSCSGQEASAPVTQPDTTATAGETAAAAPVDSANTDVAGTAATAPATPAPQGAGVVAGEVGGRPKLTVYFDSGKSAVTNDLATAATALKDYMAKNPAAKIAVSGYNDPSGNAALNAELSKKRAQGVAKALESVGIPAAAINLEKPAASTDAAASAAEARRVEVVVKP
jgi:outer membrane protein OmpA-like peptidoglycan-associated protein